MAIMSKFLLKTNKKKLPSGKLDLNFLKNQKWKNKFQT